MKKLISVLLAAVLLLSACIPALAADQEIHLGDAQQSATADVYTKTTKDDADVASYSVTIPADFKIPWGDKSAHGAPYTVTSQLLIGAKLKVTVTADNSAKMTRAGSEYFLAYTLAGGDTVIFSEMNKNVVTTPTVAVQDFSRVPVADYTGTLIYTVEYVEPAAA